MHSALSRRERAAFGSPWGHVFQAGAMLAAGMGIGRFVYTPILPLMHAQAGLSAEAGANLATANYIGYLAGALIGILAPALVRSQILARGSLVLLVVTLAAMSATHDVTAWIVLRLVAGVVSALIFVIAINSSLSNLRGQAAALLGWAVGGVGAGIALSGVLVLILRTSTDWQASWWAAAALAAVLSAVAWNLRVDPPAASGATSVGRDERPRTHRWFSALFVGYTLEGVGYIIAGTFLVAAIEQTSPGWLGSGAWVLVGLAAAPSPAVWAWLGRRWSRPDLLLVALIVQAVGIALPALVGGAASALVAAFLFGATFLGVSTIVLATGDHLRFPRSVALLTAGYSAGQILGPLLVTPLVRHGYHHALILAAAVVLAAGLAAVVLRIGFPHHHPPSSADHHQTTARA